jgi:hypothetical protein
MPGAMEEAGWASANVRVGVALRSEKLTQQFSIVDNNVFNESYTQYLITSCGFDFNEPGRSFVAGSQIGF